jgi:hypothetical protein
MDDYFDDHICTNCGYQGPAKGVDTCPECAARMMSMKDLGRYNEDPLDGLDPDDPLHKGSGDVESFEDLQDEEDKDDDEEY